jgi:hypothetical protein
MKRFFILAAALTFGLSMSAQTFVKDHANVDSYRPAYNPGSYRHEIVLPQVNGYTIYKADLHTHSIYSDGDATPEWRVKEAWYDGLDVLAITEHVEYRRHEGNMIAFLKGYVPEGTKAINTNLIGKAGTEAGIQSDLNFPVTLAEKTAAGFGIVIIKGAEITRTPETVGHFNALFTTDNNKIYDVDPIKSVQNAKAQGALIMHNHPGWRRKSLDMTEPEKKLYEMGLIDGIEVNNGSEFYPMSADRAREHKLFVAACTDIHDVTSTGYAMNGYHRNMTWIFAKDNSQESLKEALESGRTLSYGFGGICGDEQLLKDFAKAAFSTRVISENSKGVKTYALTNNTSVPFLVNFGGNNVWMEPFSTFKGSVAKDKPVTFTVLNMFYGVEKHPVVEINL